jgi:uncharacterized membrane protein YfhO
MQESTLYVNGDDKGSYFGEYEWSVREGGYYSPGDEISIKFVLDEDSLEIDNAYFYYESKQVLKAWYKEAALSSCDITKISSSHLSAKVNIRDSAEYLVFTIPYEKDWTVRLDGRKIKPSKVMDALMAVRITEGEHEIDLKYTPRGLLFGTPVSIIGIIATFCVVFIQKKKKTQDVSSSEKSVKSL